MRGHNMSQYDGSEERSQYIVFMENIEIYP